MAVGAAVAVALGAAAPAVAQSRPEVLPLDQEVELALSAAPPHVRDGAGVYALTDTGFVKARDSSNGFTCVVNRDHPLSLKPTCYDAEGTETILPKVLFMGRRLLEGTSLDEIRREVRDGFASGRFRRPQRPGVAYMLSPHIRNAIAATGEVRGFPPHVMFYAPDVTNADIGTKPGARRSFPSVPMVAYQGPHGFFVVVVDPPPVAGAADGLRALRESYVRAFNDGDVEAMRPLYTEKAVRMPADGAAQEGRDRVLTSHRTAFAGRDPDAEITLETVDVEVRGATATERGRYRKVVRPRGDAEPRIERGSYMALARRAQDGLWRYEWTIFSRDGSRPSPSATR